jgi:uncharacterized protein (TIRG00374 family)
MDAPPAAESPNRKKQIVASIVTLVTLALVFAVILPQFADYGQAWDAITAMSAASLALLALFTIGTIAVYVWPYQAALPGIRYGPAFVIRQTSFAISNGIPAGGAFGLGVQYEMLSGYGYAAGPATAAIGVTSVWNTLVTLGMPVLAVVVLALSGDFDTGVLAAAAVGLVVLSVVVGALVLVFRSESAARRLGGFADRLVGRVMHLFRKDAGVDLTGGLLDFRASTVDLVRRRWAAITATNALQQLMQFVVLYVALRAVQSEADTATTLIESFVAFSVGRLGSFVPVTPGGLGTVDAAITAILVAFDTGQSDALAAVLVWRAATYFPQIFIGIGTFLFWRRRKRKGRLPA